MTVKWKWSAEEPVLFNNVSCYKVKDELRKPFDAEIQSWIDEGILVPAPDEKVSCIIPLMAVEQASKGKVRPVLDFKQLNKYVSCHTGGSSVCDEAIRRWRKVGVSLALLDLRKAYLQLRVDPILWKHQIVQYEGRYYYLTRLGFGLSSAPRIMGKILKAVLELDDTIARATDSYLDDILVNEKVASAETVRLHLQRYGLVSKEPVLLQ